MDRREQDRLGLTVNDQSVKTVMGLPEVLTTREAAEILRCSKAHFCHLLNGVVTGVPPLPYLQLGRRRLVRKAVLIEWIEQVERRTRHGEK